MSSAITTAGQARISELMGTEQALVIDRMLLALIPDLDASQAVDRDQQLPDPEHIVHTADIADENKGYVGPDEVVYSIVLGSDLGDFSFNWIGTLEKDTDTVITVTTTPETPKRRTDLSSNTTGNCITRNIILAFQNAQAVTGITVTAQTWQFDYEAAFALHAAGAVDPTQTGTEKQHITNDQAKEWDEGIKSNTTRLGAFESSTSLVKAFEPNKIQAELFATGYTLYEEAETTWEVDQITGSAIAIDGGVYEAHGLTVYDLNKNKAAVVRRTDNDGVLNAFFRDADHPAWTPAQWEWKRDAGNGMVDVEYQVPARGIFDMKFESAAGLSGIDPVIDHIIFVECESGKGGTHRPPSTPAIVFPADGATDIMEQPSLTTSAFYSPVGEAAQGVRFRISTTQDFSNILVDSWIVPGVSWSPAKGILSVNTTYYVQALHIDIMGGVSQWTPVVSFTTASTFVSVDKPICITPAAGSELGTPDGLTLVSSAFSSSGGDDTHINSQFQLANDPGATDIIHDSGADDINLISYNVPDSTVTRGQTFYWRVRHEGETGGWSDWSVATVFSISVVPPVEDIFSATPYTGTGETQHIDNGIDLAGEGGLVWMKRLSSAGFHILADTERGTNQSLSTNSNQAAQSNHVLESFNVDGFTLQNASGDTNFTNENYISWTFRKALNFFDVVTYIGDGQDNRDIAHNLGIAPGMIIIKRLDTISEMVVGHKDKDAGNFERGYLNKTDAFAYGGNGTSYARPNGSNETTFNLYEGSSAPANERVNVAGASYVAFLFAHDPSESGIIQCGSYIGNGSTTSPEISLGWEPQFMLLKSATDAGHWFMLDSARGLSEGNESTLLADSNEPENWFSSASFQILDPTPDGFKLMTAAAQFNALNSQFIYMAIRKPAA